MFKYTGFEGFPNSVLDMITIVPDSYSFYLLQIEQLNRKIRKTKNTTAYWRKLNNQIIKGLNKCTASPSS